jgi:hypothetical protein
VRALRDAREGAHPGRLDLGPAPDLDLQAGQSTGALGERAWRHLVGRRVLEVAARVGGLGGGGRPFDLAARVVVRGDDQLVEPRVVVAVGLEGAVLVVGEHGAFHEAWRVDVVGNLPAQPPGAQLAGAAGHRGRRDAGALGVEVVALAEAGEHVTVAAGVGDGELAQAGARFARVHEPLQDSVDVMGDPLSFEDADGDRVGSRVRRRLSGRTHAH